MSKRGRILVIRGGAIGDFILTLPALHALRQTFSESHLEVLGYPAVAALAQAGGMIDGFRSIEARPLARFFARQAELDPDWSRYFASFHLILSYLYDPDDLFKTNVGRASSAQFIQGPHRPLETEDRPASIVFLQPLERLGIFEADPIPRLKLPQGPGLPQGWWVAVHPGSGSAQKNWPEENWLRLLQSILDSSDWSLLLVGGEAEGDRLERMSRQLSQRSQSSQPASGTLIQSCPSPRCRVQRSLPLAQLAGELAQCALFLGHDSGITHLAAALGVPAIALWGPSREAIWRPPHPHVEIVRGEPDLAQLAFEPVWEAWARTSVRLAQR